MKIRRRLIFCAICLGVSACVSSVTVKVVAFNDFHGNLETPGKWLPAAGQPEVAVGGADYLAAYIAQKTSLNHHHVVVSAGDLIGASPLISAAFHDEATIQVMNTLGLDFSAVGNHEFDAGSVELLRKQAGGCFPNGVHTCLGKRTFGGASFQYLAANVVSTADGKTLLAPYAIKRFAGMKIAFIGVVLKETASIVLPAAVAGLTFKDEADTINELVPILHAQAVHAIVVLIHQGGVPTGASYPANGSINDCAGLLGNPSKSPILAIVSRLDDAVDLVVSAHTHRAYNCRLPNRSGRKIPVTQAGDFGRMFTDLNVTLDRRSGRVTNITASNQVVSQPGADDVHSPVHAYLSSRKVAQIRRIVADYRENVAPIANQVIGSILAPVPTGATASGEQPAGDLIADAQLAVTAPTDRGGAVLSFVNAGGVRPPGFNRGNVAYPHEVTYAEAFAVRPWGNSLVTMTLTAQNLKDLLEQQFAGCNGQMNDGILQVSNGFHVEWSETSAPCSRIINASLATPAGAAGPDSIVIDRVVQHPAKTYRVTVDNFLAAGKAGFTVLLQGSNVLVGVQDIDAIVAFMQSNHRAPNPPFDPSAASLHVPRITKLR